MLEDTTDFVAVLVVYLEVGTVVDTVVLGFDLALDSNFAVRVVVGNSVFADYFEAIAVEFVLAWFVRLVEISDYPEIVATVVAVVLVAVARVVAKIVDHFLVGFQPERSETVEAVAPVVAIAVDYFLVALAVAKTVVDVFEYFVAQVVEVAVEEFDFVVVAAILGLVADLCLLAVDIEHLVVVGFDIAVVAIDLVWAVGLLQIQNCLDYFAVYFDLAAVERSVGSSPLVFVLSLAAVPFALVLCLGLCRLCLLVVSNSHRY